MAGLAALLAPAGASSSSRLKYPRRPPSQAEQARRRAWGRKWGALVSQAVKDALRAR